MKVEDVERRVAEIAAKADDWEVAGRMEAELWLDVLSAIANGVEDHKALAAAALKSWELDFPRKNA